MNYELREQLLTAKKAPMAEMFYLAKEHLKPGDKLINFASGHPSSDVFQTQLLAGYFKEAMERQEGESLLQYGSHVGYQPLRECLKQFLNQKGTVVRQEDDIMITYGATEAIFLTAMAFLQSGDRVIVEEPTYVKSIEAFKVLGAQLVSVSMEEDGVNLEALETAMREGAKFYYTVPDFGNPSGITMSLEKRRAVCELAERYHVMILEDNPYGELRYRKETIPRIKALDESGVTVHVGSVSKIIAPGLRVGFIVAEKELIRKLTILKGISSNGVSSITQYAVWKMFTENDMDAEIQKICNSYAKKLWTMEACMKEWFPENVRFSSPDGGMYLWVTMPQGTDIQRFCRESAVKLHIPITPGNGFCAKEPEKCTSMRFNFVKESVEDIEYGIRRVGRLMEEYITTVL